MQLTELLHYFAPAIIVCYFLLSSIINTDYKGVIVILGIGLTIATCILSSNILRFSSLDKNEICNLVSINRISGISKIPLSVAIYTYTGSYLLYTIGTNNYVLPNLIPFILFPFIVLVDLAWISNNRCFTGNQTLLSIAIGTVVGILWSILVDSTKIKNLQYFAGNGENSCLIPKHQTFKCKTKTKS